MDLFWDTNLEPIASDVGFTEGPVWIDDRLFFSSLTTGKIYSYSDTEGLDIYTYHIIVKIIFSFFLVTIFF